MGLGYEYVLDADLPGNAPLWAAEAVQKLSAKPVEPGRYDLVLLPSHLFLTIHESIAHPTELDRIFGFEANYAGTSFIYPLEQYLGTFRYGPEFMQIQGERSTPGALATVGWDDEGVKPDEYLIVKDGVLHDLQTTREQAPWLADYYGRIGQPVRSHGNSYAQSWADVQFQRMPNVNLLPNTERDISVDELLSAVENGILIRGTRLVQHRPAALQRAVRRPSLLRDSERPARRDAQGCRISDPHSRVLERDGRDRWAEHLSARGHVQRRQGTALAVQCGEPRLPGQPLPRRQRDQHLGGGLSSAR